MRLTFPKKKKPASNEKFVPTNTGRKYMAVRRSLRKLQEDGVPIIENDLIAETIALQEKEHRARKEVIDKLERLEKKLKYELKVRQSAPVCNEHRWTPVADDGIRNCLDCMAEEGVPISPFGGEWNKS